MKGGAILPEGMPAVAPAVSASPNPKPCAPKYLETFTFRQEMMNTDWLFEKALLPLVDLAEQVSVDSSVWLLWRNPGSDGRWLLFGNGACVAAPGAPGSLQPDEFFGGRAVEGDGSWQALSRHWEGAQLLGGLPVPRDSGGVAGVFFLTTSRDREIQPSEKALLRILSEQLRVRERCEFGSADIRAAAGSEGTLCGAREDLALIAEQVLDVACKIDLNGVIQSVKVSGGDALGYRIDELIGRPVFDLIYPDDRRRGEKAFKRGLQRGRAEVELRCIRGDGRCVHLDCFGGALRDESGRAQGMIVAARDISKRKEAEAAVQRLETRLQLVWENSRDAMRLIDEKGVLVQVNDAYCRLVEKTREELVGKPFVVAYGYMDPDRIVRDFQRRFRERVVPPRLELELPLWSGKRRIFQLASSFFEVEDRALLLTIYRDVTDRRKEEAELKVLNEALRQRAAQLRALTLQLTRAEQQERRRLAQIVHDHLQQILVAARLTTERVRKRSPDEEISRSISEVEQLLDESIKAARSITTELSPPVLHDGGLVPALDWLGRRMRDKHNLVVSLATDPAAEPPSEVVRVFLFEAVRELLFNCFKHAGVNDVRVVLSVHGEDQVQIVVEDAGAGFDMDAVHAGRIESHDCFGLFSLHERIDHLGGRMDIVSSPGKGTRVVLVAPLDPQRKESGAERISAVPSSSDFSTKAPPGAPPGEAKDSGGIRLVLVDDHKIMRQGLRELLREQPDMVVIGEAENGMEGLQLAQRLQPDAVIMDVSMPVMSGIEATRVLHQELPDIRVIGLSMHEKEDMAEAMLEAGAVAYVTKSAASETLTSTIRNCLGVQAGSETGREGNGIPAGSRTVGTG